MLSLIGLAVTMCVRLVILWAPSMHLSSFHCCVWVCSPLYWERYWMRSHTGTLCGYNCLKLQDFSSSFTFCCKYLQGSMCIWCKIRNEKSFFSPILLPILRSKLGRSCCFPVLFFMFFQLPPSLFKRSWTHCQASDSPSMLCAMEMLFACISQHAHI